MSMQIPHSEQDRIKSALDTASRTHEEGQSSCRSALVELGQWARDGIQSNLGKGPLPNFAIKHARLSCATAEQMHRLNLSLLSAYNCKKIQLSATKLNEVLKSVREFSTKVGDNNIEAAEKLAAHLLECIDEFLAATGACFGSLFVQGPDFESLQKDVIKPLKDKMADADSVLKQIHAQHNEASGVLKKVRERAGALAVAEFTEDFDQRAVQARGSAKLWVSLTWMAGVFMAISASSSVVLSIRYVPESVEQAVQIAISKVLVFSVLSFFAIWSSRNHKAARHNEMLYHHRASSLRTYNAFTAAANTQEAREAVLLLCAEAAFGNRSTGFDHSEQPEAGNHFVSPVLSALQSR